MARRRVKSRRFQGKMAKLKSALSGNLSQFGTKMGRSMALFMLILVVVVQFGGHLALPANPNDRNSRRGGVGGGLNGNREAPSTLAKSSDFLAQPAISSRQARKLTSAKDQDDKDPMEPCYLANNRASETLTISESTPVGTVVGEIMVIGDLENIELSIRMPGGSGHSQAGDDFEAAPTATAGNNHQTGAANGRYPAQSRVDPARGSGQLSNSSAASDVAVVRSNNVMGTRRRSRPKSVRDLSEKIDLMPPLSLEHGTKRLILAKKLDRENLEKYLQSSGGSSMTQSSSASLTVHVKCQLKTRKVNLSGRLTTLDQRQTIDRNEPSSQLVGGVDLDVNMNSTGSANKQDNHGDSRATINSILIPVHLIITDENDNWPVFSTGPYIIDLNETAPVGSLLQNNEILAFDEDQPGPLSTIEYSIVQGSFWSDSFGFLNPLDSRSLIVKDNRLLDYESQPKLILNVMARDQGDLPNWAITTLYVNLLDQDDMNPVFSDDKYQGTIRENRPDEKIEITPRRLAAHDGDRMLSAPITYSFFVKTNESMHFDLDSESGQLTLKKSLANPDSTDVTASGSAQASFCLLIKATQLDNPQRWSITAVTINWADHPILKTKIDSRTEVFGFGHAIHTIEISESAPVGTVIFTARANFGRGEITYQLLDNELGYLNIDENSGRLTLKKPLDYEVFRQLSVRILATTKQIGLSENQDVGNSYPRLKCDIVRLNINIDNFNDYSPEFSHDLYNFQLSISDLIANFEQDSGRSNQNSFKPKPSHGNLMSINALQQEEMRTGRASSSHETIDEFGHRAILLGQIYCADRDYGDEISLHLAGSRASLFYLAQDGRLYLPLTNSTSGPNVSDSRNQFGAGKSHQHHIVDSHGPTSGIFSTIRRSDDQNHDDSLDRAYLNYLLSELGNLGLLRLKVHASDNSQPEPKRSTALIVISIISIDNFIIQRSSSLNSIHGDLADARGKSNDENSGNTGTNLNDSIVDAQQDELSGHEGEAMPTMMIPSTNGRSFVHINPDIVGNLLSTTSNMNVASHTSTRTRIPDSLNGNFKTSQLDPLESLSSNTVTNMMSQRETRLNHVDLVNGSKYRPPGLLLVDEEGAKFVAMPTAMEVYNQHVKEANGHQRLRTRFKQQHQLADIGAKGKKSAWYHLGDKLGIEDEGGLMRWINISTAIALHLIVIACILSLAIRFKLWLGFGRRYSSSDGSGSDSNFMDSQPDLMLDHNLGGFNRWPKNISNFGSFLVDKQSEPTTSDSSATNYTPTEATNSVNQYSTQTKQESYRDGEFDRHVSVDRGEEFSASKHPNSGSSQQNIVSSGVLVSAKSKGKFVARHPKVENDMGEISPETRCHQQNLFEHLKITLDKIIDNDNAEGNKTNQVGLRPTGIDIVDTSSQQDRQLDVCAHLEETTEFRIEASKKSLGAKSSISTFVGTNTNPSNASNQKRSSPMRTNENNLSQSIVSINVGGPKAVSGQHQTSTTKNESRSKNSTSSNSSIVSLVSMSSSSLSNKITAAATGKAGTTGSDSTSLNSSILLQTCGGVTCSDSSTSSAKEKYQRTVATKHPPAPPPLPPPPSLIRATVIDGPDCISTNIASSGGKLNKIAHPQDQRSKFTSFERLVENHSPRQVQPENPAHLRLRRNDQLHSSMNSRCGDDRQMSMNCCGKVELTNATHRANSSIVGRREARTGQQQQVVERYNQRTRVSVANVVKRDETQSGKASTSPPTSSSNKTVSPTTSVDRGYESFQSFGAQPNGVHFASLPDYPQVCNNYECEQDLNYMPNTSAGRRGAKLLGKKQLGDRVYRKSMKSNASKAAGGLVTQTKTAQNPRMGHTTTESRSSGPSRYHEVRDCATRRATRLDCDTEDDDFYYYCSDSVHDDELHQVGCLSYSSHAYQQQIPLEYQFDQTGSKSVNHVDRPIDHGSRRAKDTTRGGDNGGRKIILYKPDLNGQSSNQLGAATSQICDMMACEGRRGLQSGRPQQIGDGQSSQNGGEVSVKRLTWSDQVY